MAKKVLISGCNGKMGKLVYSAIQSCEDMYVVAGLDKKSSNKDFPVYSNINEIFPSPENYPDIIIDFSSPECTSVIVEFARKLNIPVVIATTGLTEETKDLLISCSNYIPIFQSANMSFDVALFKNILKTIAVQLYDTDIELSETHHNRKKDAPSGTALMLAEAINESLGGTKKLIYGREGKREKNEIGLSSIRGGNITGQHTVHFFGEHETLEIKHTTYSPEVFAEGAVKAAQFLLTKKKGFFTMDDLIESL